MKKSIIPRRKIGFTKRYSSNCSKQPWDDMQYRDPSPPLLVKYLFSKTKTEIFSNGKNVRPP